MRLPLYALTLFLGIVLAVHLAMIGAGGAALNNPRVGNALFWIIGAAMATIIGLTGWQAGALGGLRQVHPVLLTAGAIGACLVFGIAWLIPQIGASSVMFGLLAGQILGGMVMSHYGWLGSPVQPVSMVKWCGLAQAWTLPIISLGTLYLVYRHMPREMRATPLGHLLLWVGAIVITGFVLMAEARRWGLWG